MSNQDKIDYNDFKDEKGKPKWSLFPWEAAEKVVEVMMWANENQYEEDSWKKVPDAKRKYINASIRHIIKDLNGECYDEETNLLSLAHAATDILFALDFAITEHIERQSEK